MKSRLRSSGRRRPAGGRTRRFSCSLLPAAVSFSLARSSCTLGTACRADAIGVWAFFSGLSCNSATCCALGFAAAESALHLLGQPVLQVVVDLARAGVEDAVDAEVQFRAVDLEDLAQLGDTSSWNLGCVCWHGALISFLGSDGCTTCQRRLNSVSVSCFFLAGAAAARQSIHRAWR